MYRYSNQEMKNILRPIRLTLGAHLLARNVFALAYMKPKINNYQWQTARLTTPLTYGLSQTYSNHKSIIKSSY